MTTVLSASHTHLYPGARGRLAGAGEDGRVRVEFADGAVAGGRLAGTTLRLDPHVTAAGTRVAGRQWALELADGRFRVLRRLD